MRKNLILMGQTIYILTGMICFMKKTFSIRQQNSFSVTIWGAFSSIGLFDLAFIVGRLDSRKYQQVLQRNLLTKWSYLADEDYIFQQGNSTIHTSSSTKI